MQKKSWVLGIVMIGVASGALLSAACTSGPDPSTGSSESNLDKHPSASKPSPSSSSSSSSAAPGGSAIPAAGGDQACAAKGDACNDCCDQAHAGGVETRDSAEAACLCVPTRCATECAQSECNQADNAPDPVAGDACSTCMAKYENTEGTGECDKAVDAALQAKGGEAAALKACQDACP